MDILAVQTELRPALPSVFAAKDYREFRATIEEMDRILSTSWIEHRFIMRHLDAMDSPVSPAKLQRHYNTFRRALRHSILLGITGYSYRTLSLRIADSTLFQWFTHTALVDGARPVSKSTIERFEKMFSDDEIAEMIHDLNRAVMKRTAARELLYRETKLHFDQIFADTTCVKANIHFPVDWVLLRDASRTLINAIVLIRLHGLKHRICDPAILIKKINQLCIEMTHTRKKKDGKKHRKKVFRRMKKLTKIIGKHAENYYHLLEARWSETDWTELETQVVLDRIQGILDQLPQAIHQAHERIIGERRVNNKDKILSLYDSDIHVLVRGKAGAEVEFGNALYLAEQVNGLIVDWELIKGQPGGDNKLVKASIERISQNYAVPQSYATDRGFDSSANQIILEELEIFNAMCPRSVAQLEEKLKDEDFCCLQKRRGSTEARIGIFKNAYLGKPLRSKGFRHRKVRITWCILSHNLWKLSRMAAQKRAKLEVEAQAA